MSKITLQQNLVSNLICPDGKKKKDYFDTKVRGLYLEVRCSGTRTFYLRYTDKRGKVKSLKISNNNDLSLKEVRVIAESNRADVAKGLDPVEEKKKLRSTIKFRELVQEHYLPYAKAYKKSWAHDLSNLNNHILPILGDLYVDQVRPKHVLMVVRERVEKGGAPGSANLSLCLIRYIFNLAIDRWGLQGIDKNPAKHIKPLKEDNDIQRFLSEQEVQRLSEAVNQSQCIMLKYIFSMLILTGARKREVLDCQWQDFCLINKTWTIKKTKSGKPRQAYLSDVLIRTLCLVQALNIASPYVFPNPDTGLPYKNIFTAWDSARKSAGLPEVRLHDLRHSFASTLINNGRSLYEVQKLLGHANSKMTERYAHLNQCTLREAAAAASHKLNPSIIDGEHLSIANLSQPQLSDGMDPQLRLLLS